ncbi:MAG: formate dehydrogenase accessory sulfurtransferase FdhD [Cytophagales bacterium]|nr:formate dehydrogenase accessory sulfurtransferase FdhD [Cytophagales bacterium]
MINKPTAQLPVRKVTSAQTSETTDILAVEEPLEIRVTMGATGHRVEKVISVTMRTPGNDEELALGFLFTEGIISGKKDVIQVHHSENDNVVTIDFDTWVVASLDSLERNFYTTSSCGVCGKTSLEAIRTKSVFTGADSLTVTSSMLHTLPELLRKNQEVFATTGGLHASALFDTSGKLLIVREDVGRHNALDKVIGHCAQQNRLPQMESILLLSGRVSFELMQKAYMAGIRMVAAIGAPSTLAVSLAAEYGITLIGFLRNQQFTVYAGAQRIQEK